MRRHLSTISGILSNKMKRVPVLLCTGRRYAMLRLLPVEIMWHPAQMARWFGGLNATRSHLWDLCFWQSALGADWGGVAHTLSKLFSITDQPEDPGQSSQCCFYIPVLFFFILFKVFAILFLALFFIILNLRGIGNKKGEKKMYNDSHLLTHGLHHICLILLSFSAPPSVHFSKDIFEVNLDLFLAPPAPAAISALLMNDYLGAQWPYWTQITPPVLFLWLCLQMLFLSYLVRECALMPARDLSIGLITSSELIIFKAWWLC